MVRRWRDCARKDTWVLSLKTWHECKSLSFCALLLVSQDHRANVHLQVDGISNDLESNVCARLSTIVADEVTADARFQSRIDNLVREGLRALGYYSPTVDFVFKSAVHDSRDVLIVRITPGKPIKIASVNVILHGDARQDIDYRKLVTDANMVSGRVLNHQEFDRFKNSFSSLALHKGYFDAAFRKSKLFVSPERYKAFWDIDFDSGQRYCFGKVRFHGAQIRKDYLKNLTKMREGDLYSTKALAKFNNQLAATNWFNSVTISPDFENSKQSKFLPLDTFVTPRTQNSIEIGVGYATDVGPRVKTTWSKPWLNSCGHSLQTRLSMSASKQSANINYKIPLLKDPLEQYYLLQGGFKHEYLNEILVDSKTLNVARYWNLSSGWQRAVNLRWSLDHFRQTNITDTTMLMYPVISINRTRKCGGLMPSWCDSQNYSIDVSNTIWGSDIDFFIFQAKNVWVHALSEKHRFVARDNLGWIETNNFERVPPSLRFFAGGDRSIRGYKYGSLSPRNNSGKPTGASKIVTGSIEYQYKVTDKWWGAAFVDSGELINNITESNIKIGAGVGVRWQSPVGSIKFDIAVPVADEHENSMQFYIGLGPEL